MKSLIIKPLLIVSIVSVSIAGCKKDDDKEDVKPTPKPATVEAHFHPVVGTTSYAVDKEFTMTVGTTTYTYKFNENTAFYVSGIELENSDGDEVEIEDSYLLVKPAADEYEIGQVKAGTYEAISFNVGIDSAANHADPSTYAEGHPLALQNPSMHWGWNPGYRFLVMEGHWTASTGEDGDFTFHIGLDEFLKHIHLHFHHEMTLAEGKSTTIHMNIDYGKIMEGIDLKTENFTKSMTASEKPLAKKIVDNLENAFILE